MQQWRGASQDGKGGGRRCGYTTHGPRQKRALLSEPQQAAGALASGQWPVGPRTHRHTQRKKSARTRYGEWPARIHAQVRHTPPGVALRGYWRRSEAGCAEGASNDEAAQSKQRERRRSDTRTTRTRHDKEAAERPEYDERRSRAARSTHARLAPRRSPDAESRDPHAPLACRERGASQHARAGEAEWRKEKRRQERHPPREGKRCTPRTARPARLRQ